MGALETPSPLDPASLRAGDADREAVADRLRISAGDGRIDLTELDERLEQAYGARTYAELDVLVADLPPERPVERYGDAPEVLTLSTRVHNVKQDGRWTVPPQITAETTTGLVTIDFTEAVCTHPEVAVSAVCGSGWIRLILPAGWGARVDPASTNTGHIRLSAATTADPGCPTVTVTGHPRSGYIKVRQRR